VSELLVIIAFIEAQIVLLHAITQINVNNIHGMHITVKVHIGNYDMTYRIQPKTIQQGKQSNKHTHTRVQ